MASLRETNKAARQQRILSAATTLFRRKGFEPVKMGTIAKTAKVSVGTIYNYYRNKGDLLVAIVSLEVSEVLASGKSIITNPPADVFGAINTLIENYISHSLVYLSKEMWRQAMAISTQQPESPFGVAYGKLDDALSDQVCQLIKVLQQQGSIKPSVNARSVGELLFNNTDRMFINFVKSEKMTVKTLLASIQRQNQTLIDAIT